MSDAVRLVADLGGELVTYSPYGGTAKQFKAIVEREPSQPAPFGGAIYPENSMLVTFPRHATDGVLSVAKGKDKISFKRHLSDAAATEYTVVMIQDEDAGLAAGDGGMYTVVVK